MMKAVVAFDGEEFVVNAIPHPVNAEQMDYSLTIENARRLRHQEHPLADPLNEETVVISVRRFVDGEGFDVNPDVEANLDRDGTFVTPEEQRRDSGELRATDHDDAAREPQPNEGPHNADSDTRQDAANDAKEDVEVVDEDASDENERSGFARFDARAQEVEASAAEGQNLDNDPDAQVDKESHERDSKANATRGDADGH